MMVMVTLAIEMTKKPDRQTCISPGAIGCECTEAEAAMAATSPAIPVPAAIIWGAECVSDFSQIWILKQMFSFFHFLSNFNLPFLSHLFPYPNIATSIIFAPALRFEANEDSLQCQCEVGFSLTNLTHFVEISTLSFINFPPLGDAGGQILAIKWDWRRILVLWEPSVQTFG